MKEYPLLKQAYGFSHFNKSGKDLIDKLTHYLHAQQQSGSPANNWKKPELELSYWQNYSFENLNQFVDDLLEHSIHLHNPKYMGHQVAAPAPLSVLMNLLSGMLNNGMAVYEMGQAATAIEKVVIEMFCQKVGYDHNSNGIMTSGGTLANLTALLAARQDLEEEDIWQQGHCQKLAVLVSSQAHYSIDRAARIMGLGDKGVVLVEVNDSYSMDIKAMETSYNKCQQEGLKVMAIVGSACSTATGSYDDLEAIAHFCQKHKLWFHVDGAHGGAAVFSNKHKHLLTGIHQADSIIIDTHKMMMTPALSTVVLFKDKIKGSQTFQQKAQYLFEDKSLEEQWYNGGLRTFECTKFMICLKFYILWKNYGLQLFEENIDCLYGLGTRFAEIIASKASFELALQPKTNIVCFRYIQDNLNSEQLNTLNKNIRQEVLEDNEYYIVQAVLEGCVYLRVTFMNPLTQEEHLHKLLERIEKTAYSLINS